METHPAIPLLGGSNGKELPSRGGWRSAIYIIWVEIAEQFSYCGILANIIIYLTNVLHEPAVSAAEKINIWAGVSSLLPLLGAFVADSYLGRYRTMLYAFFIYLLGVATLTLSATPAIPHHFQRPVFYLSLYVMAVGQGGHKPCAQAFGADQFHGDNEENREAMQSFFNWWYFGTACGMVSGIVILSYVQEYVDWAIGFGIPAIVVVIALGLFMAGRKSYRRQSPSGSPLTQVAQVLVAAVRKRHLLFVEGDEEKEKPDYTAMNVLVEAGPIIRTKKFKFLDKATIKDEVDASCGSTNDWRLCSTIQVEEVKQLLRLLPIWFSCLMFAVASAQTFTFFTKQCSTMNRNIWSSFEVTPASFQLSIHISAILTIPIYDRIAIPVLKKITKNPSGLTILQRIGAGMFLSLIQMVVAAVVEAQRLRIAKEHGLDSDPNATIPISVWWLLPQNTLFGVGAVLTMVGLQQLFYEEMPDGMRSLGSASVDSIFGIGQFLSSFIMSLVEAFSNEWLADNLNSAHLDYFYWLLAGLSSLWFGGYVTVSRRFVYKQKQGCTY